MSLQTEEPLLPQESFVQLEHGQPRELRHKKQLANKKREELQQKTREGKEEAWELFRRQPSLRQRKRSVFEEEFRTKGAEWRIQQL